MFMYNSGVGMTETKYCCFVLYCLLTIIVFSFGWGRGSIRVTLKKMTLINHISGSCTAAKFIPLRWYKPMSQPKKQSKLFVFLWYILHISVILFFIETPAIQSCDSICIRAKQLASYSLGHGMHIETIFLPLTQCLHNLWSSHIHPITRLHATRFVVSIEM